SFRMPTAGNMSVSEKLTNWTREAYHALLEIWGIVAQTPLHVPTCEEEAHDDHTQPHHRCGSRQGGRRSLLREDVRAALRGLRRSLCAGARQRHTDAGLRGREGDYRGPALCVSRKRR